MIKIKETLDMIDSLNYSALYIEYRPHENKRYYVYGFKSDSSEWKIEDGDLILVTENTSFIKTLKQNFRTIDSDFQYCKSCFEKKKIEPSYYVYSIPKWVPENILINIQNSLLKTRLFNWLDVSTMLKKHKISLSYCKKCNDNCNYWEYKDNKLKHNTIENIHHQEIAQYILNTRKEKILEHYLKDNMHLIEPGMKHATESDYKKLNKSVDALGIDANNTLCIFELKVIDDDKTIVFQTAYYQSGLKENVRVITIAPNYKPNIYEALQCIKNVELMTYSLNNEGRLQINKYPEINSTGSIQSNNLISL